MAWEVMAGAPLCKASQVWPAGYRPHKGQQEDCFYIKTVFPGKWIPILKIRWSWNHLSFMGIHILVLTHLFIMMAQKFRACFFIYGWANSQPMTEDVTYVMSPLIGYDHIQWQIENKPWGAVSIRKTVLPGMAIPMLKIRRPNGRLIFNMEITIRR